MDDYNPATLSEARNEYSIRLINILSPLVIEGLKSIYQEAWELCLTNDEKDKYLMTFQNFLTRVPKWNQDIIEGETKRILAKSGCTYLEDLLACVHITQLKILTSIRVATKQKKIDIAVPKLGDFIHKVYIACARKLYTSIYLFETGVEPLQRQKNMREAETVCKECILNVIRDNMPVEKILRAYMDETVEEEVVMVESKREDAVVTNKAAEEKKGDKVDKEHAVTVAKTAGSQETAEEHTDLPPPKPPAAIVETEVSAVAAPTAPKGPEPPTSSPTVTPPAAAAAATTSAPAEAATAAAPAKVPPTAAPAAAPVATPPAVAPAATPRSPGTSRLQFNDKDTVLSYDGQDKVTQLEKRPVQAVSAPKTAERLEAISAARHAQRRAEEEEEDDEESNMQSDKIKILSDAPPLKTDALDVQDLDKKASADQIPGVQVLY